MPPSTGVLANKTTLSYGATPTLLGQITEFNGPASKAKAVDITNFDSPAVGNGIAEEKLPGLSGTTFSAKLIYLTANETGLDTIYNTVQTFTLTLPKFGTQVTSGDKYAFSGILTSYDKEGTSGEKITHSIEIEVTGLVTFTAGA